jgi:hypothetical protein
MVVFALVAAGCGPSNKTVLNKIEHIQETRKLTPQQQAVVEAYKSAANRGKAAGVHKITKEDRKKMMQHLDEIETNSPSL